MLKLVSAGKKWGAEIYKKKEGKKTKSFAGVLIWLVLPTPLMHSSQVHMKKVTEKCCFLMKFVLNFFKILFLGPSSVDYVGRIWDTWQGSYLTKQLFAIVGLM